jgi:membrane protein
MGSRFALSGHRPADALRVGAALFRETGTRWVDDRCDRLGASLAYYAIFSLFPLLLLSLTGVGYALGEGDSIRTKILDSLTGATGSVAVRSILDETLASMQAHRTARGIGAVVGVLTLAFGASGVFSELSASLNAIWRVRVPERRSIWRSMVELVTDRAVSLAFVGAAGLLLLCSLVVSTALAALRQSSHVYLAWWPVELAASLLFSTVALATLYRTLPQTRVTWSDVFGGALLAAVLLTFLRRLLVWFLTHVGSYAAYGAVGGVLGLLLLMYLSSLVMFFGAEFTRVYAERFGSLRGHAKDAPWPCPSRT